MVPLQSTANFMLVSHLPDSILSWPLLQRAVPSPSSSHQALRSNFPHVGSLTHDFTTQTDLSGSPVFEPRRSPTLRWQNADDSIAQGPSTLTGRLPYPHTDTTDGKATAMTPEAWTVIGTGVVILIAIAASNRQIRTELSQMHAEIGQLRERMTKLEGLLEGLIEGLREAITGRKVS